MADLSVTAASVIAGDVSAATFPAQFSRGTAGAAITAGMVLYADAAASNTLKGADANLSLAAATVVGIATHAAGTGQPVLYQTAGLMTIGATVVAGKPYVLSATGSGVIAAGADLTSGWYASYLGYATTTAILNIQLNNTGVLLA